MEFTDPRMAELSPAVRARCERVVFPDPYPHKMMETQSDLLNEYELRPFPVRSSIEWRDDEIVFHLERDFALLLKDSDWQGLFSEIPVDAPRETVCLNSIVRK